jgi:hypothetical protein
MSPGATNSGGASPAAVGGRSLNVGFWHEGEAGRGTKPVRFCPSTSDVNLFSYGQGIIGFDAEIPDGALDLGMSQRVGLILRISFLI